MGNTKLYKQYKVLVLGVDDRSALTVIRSLGRKQISVHAGIDCSHSSCWRSRYTSKGIRFPSADKSPELWLQKLVELLLQEQYDLVIPTVDKYLVPIVQNLEQLKKLARFAIPDERGFLYTYNKSKTLELAESLGVPCPKSMEIEALEDIEDVLREFKLPLIVKPVSSKIWKKNVRHDLKVELARDEADLRNKLTRLMTVCPVLIQSFHKGIGVGQEFLTRNGELIAAFQHERVHEPKKGGGSSYRKSVALDPLLLEHSLKMLRELKWTGVAMVEYKYDKESGKSVLMEINGRFWGSLPLPVAAGVDFPALLFDMLVLNKFPEKTDYRENLYCRNPVKDLDWLKENIRANKSDPYTLSLPWSRVIGEIKNILLFRERWDTIVLDDPWPGIADLGAYFKENLRGARDKLYRAAIEMHYRYNFFGKENKYRRISKLLRKNPSVAFVCKGNICRSPFAGIYLKELIDRNHLKDLKVDSFGLIQKENRQSPELAVEAAVSFGVDMSAHRSKILSADAVNNSGVVFVMDIDLYKQVKELYPQAKNKLFFLGVLQNGHAASVEILDPYGQNEKKFKQVFSQITTSVDNLIRLAKNL
jgi:protein-tyrosine-phosphatase/predicted ATP-grasp superfamily ATP-dependent carboligase